MSVLNYGDVIYGHASSSTLVDYCGLSITLPSELLTVHDAHHCILYDKVAWSHLKVSALVPFGHFRNLIFPNLYLQLFYIIAFYFFISVILINL